AAGGAGFKALRGEYGSGKTFFARWLQERAKRAGFAAAEVQISEAETPLHRLETVYRRAMERLSTADASQGAFRPVVDGWLHALRQLVDEVDAGRFPGLYLVITGTPAFYDGPQGIRRLEPLAQRLHVDFQTDARFDSPRAVQVRLPGFTHDRLVEVGRTIRDL